MPPCSTGAGAFRITLDGNEQYRTLDDFLALIEADQGGARRSHGCATRFCSSSSRSIAPWRSSRRSSLRCARSRDKPVIIDEADGWVSAFKEAILLGYRGVSHKNCKGIYKSLHNLALAALHNARAGGRSCSSRPRT